MIEYHGINFESWENLKFYFWLQDAKYFDLVKKSHIQSPLGVYVDSVLIQDVQENDKDSDVKHVFRTAPGRNIKTMIRGSTYTPDFIIHFSPVFFKLIPHVPLSPLGLITQLRKGEEFEEAIIDIKPPKEAKMIRFKIPGTDKIMMKSFDNQMALRALRYKQELFYRVTGNYINVVHLEDWFKATWVPVRLEYTGWDRIGANKKSIDPHKIKFRTKQKGGLMWGDCPKVEKYVLPEMAAQYRERVKSEIWKDSNSLHTGPLQQQELVDVPAEKTTESLVEKMMGAVK
jgi:hypothetical protein